MLKKPFLTTALTCTLILTSGFALAADKDRDKTQVSAQDPIYGSQLMTVQERQDYRDLMRVAKTDKAREQIRLEHHQQMQQRAQQRGSTLPDEPPARGSGMNQGMGAGGGMGGGMGSGGTGSGKP
jgi:uncharacterized membrane protein YgcG